MGRGLSTFFQVLYGGNERWRRQLGSYGVAAVPGSLLHAREVRVLLTLALSIFDSSGTLAAASCVDNHQRQAIDRSMAEAQRTGLCLVQGTIHGDEQSTEVPGEFLAKEVRVQAMGSHNPELRATLKKVRARLAERLGIPPSSIQSGATFILRLSSSAPGFFHRDGNSSFILIFITLTGAAISPTQVFRCRRADGESVGEFLHREERCWFATSATPCTRLSARRQGQGWLLHSNRIHRAAPIRAPSLYEVVVVFKVFRAHVPPDEVPIIFSL